MQLVFKQHNILSTTYFGVQGKLTAICERVLTIILIITRGSGNSVRSPLVVNGYSKTVRIRKQIRKSKVHKYWFVFKLRNIFYQWRGTSSSMQLNTHKIHYPKTWSHGWWQVPMAPILSCTACVTHQPLRENVHHEVCQCNLSQSKCFGSQTSCYSQTATQESGSYYLCIRLMQNSQCRALKLVWCPKVFGAPKLVWCPGVGLIPQS